ncbi:hypothetical protein [Janthinobacterium psychrotolerans]|uniref:hypothetical protein n=1 Tax=Janthinobacterium psychrotolerans TaxID=1747903 RepID=UPI0012372BF6|nr:hypothetical protein [Janthinobacterium psychrotolerans]
MNCDNLPSQLEQSARESMDAPGADVAFRPVRLPSLTAMPLSDMDWVAPNPSSTSGKIASDLAGQHDVDRKAFKGRGDRRRLNKAQAAVDQVHQDMRRLAVATKSIKAKRFYLAIHTRGSTGQLSLRWRRAGTSDTSHIAWDELEHFLSPLPSDLVQWYQTVNKLVTFLNAQEKHNRSILRYFKELIHR